MLLFFSILEVNDLIKRTKKSEYFYDPWNINDFLLTACYLIFVALSFIGPDVFLDYIKVF